MVAAPHALELQEGPGTAAGAASAGRPAGAAGGVGAGSFSARPRVRSWAGLGWAGPG